MTNEDNGENIMNNTKTVLLMPEPPKNFQVRNIILEIHKDRNNECKIQPIYIQGILYPQKTT